MLQWYAESWDIPSMASYVLSDLCNLIRIYLLLTKQVPQLTAVLILAKVPGQYSWMMWPVVDLNTALQSVATQHHMVVDIVKMLVFDANLVSQHLL